MRFLLPAPLLLLLAALAAAQEPPFARESVDMMPGLAREERQALHRAHDAARRDAARIAQIDKRLGEKPPKEEAEKLGAERAALVARVEGAAGAAGLDEARLRRLLAMPRGPLREERYNHSVLLEVPALNDAQRALLLRVVAATDAAQAAGLAQREHLVRGLGEGEGLIRARIESTSDQQRRDIERRFWRVAYYLLTAEQMRAARGLFSPRYRPVPELPQQVQLLPGLTPSQSVRLRSLFAGTESENAADQAEVRRIAVRLREPDVPAEERAELGRRNGAAYARMESRNEALLDAVRATLTPAQREALEARPPHLNTGELSQGPWELVRDLRLPPGQAARVRLLEQESGKARGAFQQAEREMGSMMAEIGPESPQMMAVEAARQGGRTQLIEHLRECGRELFLEILDPARVCDWIVAPSVAP